MILFLLYIKIRPGCLPRGLPKKELLEKKIKKIKQPKRCYEPSSKNEKQNSQE